MNPLTDYDLKLLSAFNSTYNARYLRDLEDSKIKYIYSISNPVQKKLIKNLKKSIPRSFDVNYIEGPITVSRLYLKNADGTPSKTAYIFGEAHYGKSEIEGSCSPNPSIEFQEYLLRLARDSPAFIDVYVELPIIKSRIVQSRSSQILGTVVQLMYDNPINRFSKTLDFVKRTNPPFVHRSYILGEIAKEFSDCSQPALRGTNSICNIIRFHNIDIRSSYTEIENSLLTACSLLNFSLDEYRLGNRSDIEFFKVVNRIRNEFKFMDRLLDAMDGGMISLKNLFFKGNKAIGKDLEKSYKKKEIKMFALRKLRAIGFDKIQIIGKQVKLGLKEIKKKVPVLPAINVKMFRSVLLRINGICVDIYCLSRVFKYYIPRQKIKPTDPEPEDHPQESQNIIIYAGNEHSENYVDFFKSIGFEAVEYKNPGFDDIKKRVTIPKSSCVAMKKFK